MNTTREEFKPSPSNISPNIPLGLIFLLTEGKLFVAYIASSLAFFPNHMINIAKYRVEIYIYIYTVVNGVQDITFKKSSVTQNR